MTALRLDAVYVLTWGMGGEDCTLTGLTLDEARDLAGVYRAWGPVIMRLWCGQLVYAESGRPVADDNAAAVWLRHLDQQREQAYAGPQRAMRHGISPAERDRLAVWAEQEMADLEPAP